MVSHSEFSPSKAHRWLNCPISVTLEKYFPDTTSVYATEGTLAHSVCEDLIKNKGRLVKHNFKDINKDMYENCLKYYNFFVDLKPIKYWIECKINLGNVIPFTSGYCDLIVIDKSNDIHIVDFKYGKGVLVTAYNNEQATMYALGVINKLNKPNDTKIHLHIFQPRMNNISTYSTTVGELKEQLVKYKKGYLIAKGDNPPFNAGLKQCKFCKVKARCFELLKIFKKVKDIMDKLNNENLITDDDIKYILDNNKLLTEFTKSVEAQALKDALKGKVIKGYKVVEGRSNRVYTTEGKPTLAPINDKRKSYSEAVDDMFTSK